MMQKSIKRHARRHPAAEFRSIDGRYNCFGLVFASRRTTLSDEGAILARDDDGYHAVSDTHKLIPGDIAVYTSMITGKILHIGVVVAVTNLLSSPWRESVKVQSKWGEHGEYVHDVNDVPSGCGTATEFWRENSKV